MCNVTHKLWVIEKDMMNHETTFHKMWNVTHFLLFIKRMWWDCLSQNHSLPVHRKHVVRLPFTKCAMSLTSCFIERMCHKMCNTIAAHFLLVIGKNVITDETAIHKMCNVAHFLLVIGKIWWGYLSQNANFVTHFLFVIRTDAALRLPFTGCTWMSLTCCWL